jgi:hypothetical protein
MEYFTESNLAGGRFIGVECLTEYIELRKMEAKLQEAQQ